MCAQKLSTEDCVLNVFEFERLTHWFNWHGATVESGYQQLSKVLSHNATQAQQQPVEGVLKELVSLLYSLPMEELSNADLSILKHLEVDGLLGRVGARHVRSVVIRSEFDRATSASEIRNNKQRISEALSKFQGFSAAFQALDYDFEAEENIPGRVTVRVQFKDDASMSDVAAWKKWSNEWHEIVRGIALCIGESPADTRVTGATTGSLIMILSGTIGFVGALAIITKHVSFIIKEGLVITNAIEDLRHKRILNRAIEQSLNDEKQKLAKEGVKRVVAETKKAMPDKLNGEQEAVLTKAVEKFFRFNELGGDVDFVEPAESDEEHNLPITGSEIAEIRQTVEQIREARSEIKLLTEHPEAEDEDPEQ